ncbi:MAG: hypothetical protein LBB68_06900 [Treponema sp.]|jgi:hypothetical protein|nr:hypothetical protein [Treponema sp.]
MKHNIDRILGEVCRDLPAAERNQGEAFYNQGNCTLLSWSPLSAEFALSAGDGNADKDDAVYSLLFEGQEETEKILPGKNGKRGNWDRYTLACLLRYAEELKKPGLKEQNEYIKIYPGGHDQASPG